MKSNLTDSWRRRMAQKRLDAGRARLAGVSARAPPGLHSLAERRSVAPPKVVELFSTKLWEEKVPKARALWEAKKVLRDEGAPVRDWAAWVLTGDPE